MNISFLDVVISSALSTSFCSVESHRLSSTFLRFLHIFDDDKSTFENAIGQCVSPSRWIISSIWSKFNDVEKNISTDKCSIDRSLKRNEINPNYRWHIELIEFNRPRISSSILLILEQRSKTSRWSMKYCHSKVCRPLNNRFTWVTLRWQEIWWWRNDWATAWTTIQRKWKIKFFSWSFSTINVHQSVTISFFFFGYCLVSFNTKKTFRK